ncbi:HPP family protein [Halococcus sediminicola]|uniref:HPP family protein n=1 Tax=Halococcus sediminicola TaxID=1264579 RepID=UPI0009AD2A2D|nr:HPP family protein [Halococcus sediminicola]
MSILESVERAIPDRFERVERAAVELFEPVEQRPTTADALRTTTRVCSLLVALAAIAWVSGYPYLFPSLGPSAYALAVSPSAATSQPQRVFGAHLFGVVGGLVAYHLLASGLTVTKLPPAFSLDAARLAASALLSLGLTSFAMLTTDLRHAPACATTLIVALGLLTTVPQAAIILSAVLVLSATDRLFPGFGGIEDPPR